MIEYRKLFFSSLRTYFAPLVGAINAIREEIKRFDREHA